MHLVIIGCGGIAYQAVSRLCMLVGLAAANGDRIRVTVVDPDSAEEHNWTRQWPGSKGSKADTLAGILRMAITPNLRAGTAEVEAVPLKWDELHELSYVEGEGTLVFCWPDNDECRSEVFQDFSPGGRFFRKFATVITAGNDTSEANAYAMKIGDGDVMWPQTKFFSTGGDTAEGESCSAQTAQANMKAATLSFLLEDYISAEWPLGDPALELYSDGIRVLLRKVPLVEDGEGYVLAKRGATAVVSEDTAVMAAVGAPDIVDRPEVITKRSKGKSKKSRRRNRKVGSLGAAIEDMERQAEASSVLPHIN